MKKLILKQGVRAEPDMDGEEWLLEDVREIVAICAKHNYEIDQLTAYNAWSAHSEDYCASWLEMGEPRSETTMRTILKYCDVVMIYIIFHADTNGRFAAYCAWRYFRNYFGSAAWEASPIYAANIDADNPGYVAYYEVQYNKPFPLDISKLTKNDHVYILDFAFDRETMDRVHGLVGNLIVLDHHESSRIALKGAPYVIHDMTKSGALLAWEFFFPDEKPGLVCDLVNAYDLCQHDTAGRTYALEAWIRYARLGQNWEDWDELSTYEDMLDTALRHGATIYKYQRSIMKGFMDNPDNITFSKLFYGEGLQEAKIAVYNGMSIIHSQLAAEVYKRFDVDLTIEWRMVGSGIRFSIRSPDPKKFSALEFAKSYGGGGRAAAAGIFLPMDKGLNLIKYLVSKA